MESYWKAVAVIILTIILGAAIGKKEKDIVIVLTVAACCIVMLVSMEYLSEVVAFLWELGNSADDQNSFTSILLKISCVALTTELVGLLCADAGNNSLAKVMQLFGNTVILFLSLPLFEAFLSILQEIMGFL